jgi:hypothetical protein
MGKEITCCPLIMIVCSNYAAAPCGKAGIVSGPSLLSYQFLL